MNEARKKDVGEGRDWSGGVQVSASRSRLRVGAAGDGAGPLGYG